MRQEVCEEVRKKGQEAREEVSQEVRQEIKGGGAEEIGQEGRRQEERGEEGRSQGCRARSCSHGCRTDGCCTEAQAKAEPKTCRGANGPAGPGPRAGGCSPELGFSQCCAVEPRAILEFVRTRRRGKIATLRKTGGTIKGRSIQRCGLFCA